MKFTFVDLFCGIGGFHAALSAMGGKCVFACDTDPFAREVYERNWGIRPHGDIREFDQGLPVEGKIDVMVAGFPCQPFSKSGRQFGRGEERGTLVDSVLHLASIHKPSVIVLENVRNITGPKHRPDFLHICRELRQSGYLVTEEAQIFSPHRVSPEFGGRPQIRERVFITATYWPKRKTTDPGILKLDDEVLSSDIHSWRIADLLGSPTKTELKQLKLSNEELRWLEAWNELDQGFRDDNRHTLPGFPLWSDQWGRSRALDAQMPKWKRTLIEKNEELYEENKSLIVSWLRDFRVREEFPPTRRKFEWQAGDTKSLWRCAIQFRPSGIRVKKATYLPALVAMNQTSVIGPQKRRISEREAARLQGLPDTFQFGVQPLSQSYKQLGNGVNVGVVWQVVKHLVRRDLTQLRRRSPGLVDAVLTCPDSPDRVLGSTGKRFAA
jgi:DNA (cytosine-5)-methyltransferase 1